MPGNALIRSSRDSAEVIAALRTLPAGAIGAGRYKLKPLKKNRREYDRLIAIFRSHQRA